VRGHALDRRWHHIACTDIPCRLQMAQRISQLIAEGDAVHRMEFERKEAGRPPGVRCCPPEICHPRNVCQKWLPQKRVPEVAAFGLARHCTMLRSFSRKRSVLPAAAAGSVVCWVSTRATGTTKQQLYSLQEQAIGPLHGLCSAEDIDCVLKVIVLCMSAQPLHLMHASDACMHQRGTFAQGRCMLVLPKVSHQMQIYANLLQVVLCRGMRGWCKRS